MPLLGVSEVVDPTLAPGPRSVLQQIVSAVRPNTV
jgi:hypothetical protein